MLTAMDQPIKKNKGKQRAVEEDPKSKLPWVEKYRPNSLNDLIAHQEIISTIDRFIEENRLPHLLLYGPPGTGKTSTILACAKKMYGQHYSSMILELNASDDRGIGVVREQIKSFASTKKLFSSGFKLIILDEADAMTQQAQNALRRVIEQYTKNVRFCLICNYVGKIIPALQSRCTRFRFAPLQEDQIRERLKFVIDQEQIQIDAPATNALLKLSHGDMRRALNILQSVHVAHPDNVTEDIIYATTGSPYPQDIDSILSWLLSVEFTECFQRINALQIEKGLALGDILTSVYRKLSELELPAQSRIYLVDQLAKIEYNMSVGTTDRIQLAAIVGAFKIAVEKAR
ncbi:P-loop containing nucleoside triphosphate hydrolase protein [Gorgonomyces haynaldii]|nr:P-loop containing nucleoside triphosphate hydrolase protein [Gorgonomyces haynaldii]